MAAPPVLSVTDAAAAAADAYVFGYPLVLMDRARRAAAAPANTWVHERAPADGSSTLRSGAWLDLGGGPVLLTVPETHGRFYALSLVDLWTTVFACVGARATGTEAGTYAIVGPSLATPALGPDVVAIVAPTRRVRIVGRTQVDRDGGCAGAHAVQDALALRPLGPPARADWGTADADVERMDAGSFFAALDALMRDNPPRLEDRAIVNRMRRLGLADTEALPADVRRAVEDGAALGRERVRAAAARPPGEDLGGWHVRFGAGRYGVDYRRRAGAASAGIEPVRAADELTAANGADDGGERLSGRYRYALRFPPRELPPVHAYWSLTAADPHEWHAIGDRSSLVLDRDGALTIRVQQEPPPEARANWLPAPPGPFDVTLRLGWPERSVLERRWTPPPLERV
jgi:hypothetical protein